MTKDELITTSINELLQVNPIGKSQYDLCKIWEKKLDKAYEAGVREGYSLAALDKAIQSDGE